MPTLFDWRSALHPRDPLGRFRDSPDVDVHVPRYLAVRQKLLGRAFDSQQRFSRYDHRSGFRVYAKSRRPIHDGIIRHFMDEAKPTQGKATALLIAGGPGSGKSSALRKGLVSEPADAVHVDADEIMQMLPEYKELVEAGDRKAAYLMHEEASDISKRLQYVAMKLNYNVVVDGTGDGPSGTFVNKVQNLRKAGYAVNILMVNSPTDLALERVHARAKSSGRVVPDHIVRQMHRSISRRLLEILATDVEQLRIYENDDHGLTEVAHKRGKEIEVLNWELYDQLFRKAE